MLFIFEIISKNKHSIILFSRLDFIPILIKNLKTSLSNIIIRTLINVFNVHEEEDYE